MTKRTIKNLSNVVLSEESFSYDAAGNITSAPTGSFAYDTDNRLTAFNGNTVTYDMDGNLLSNGAMTCTYDSANRLLTSGGHTYTYNAEGVRIRNLCAGEDAAYTYNTNSKLSQLLMKTVGTAVTKYVYGLGLIGEETDGDFKTYHFDSRGSTIAITDEDGNITDTFAYDTYGKMTSRTGTTSVIFGYNGKYGVVIDANGLLYMRARYYSPAMRRFVNADVIPGNISKAVTLNRYAFADANPVLKVDPLGLMACPFGICPSCVGQEDYNDYLAGLVGEEELKQKYHLDTETPSVPATQPPKHTMDDDTEPEIVNKKLYEKNTAKEKEKTEKEGNSKREFYDSINEFGRKAENWIFLFNQTITDIWDSITIDIGVGGGIGGSIEVEGLEATAMLRGDLFAIVKEAGGKVYIGGKVSEVYVAAEGLHSVVQSGIRQVYDAEGKMVQEEYLEPGFNTSSEFGIGLYCLIGGTVKIGIDWEYLYTKLTSRPNFFRHEDFW